MTQTDPVTKGSLQERAFDTFGAKRQLLALAEELSEASAAVARLLNDKGPRIDVVEEIVDVESVVASLRDWLGKPEVWEIMRQRKASKLAECLRRAERKELKH